MLHWCFLSSWCNASLGFGACWCMNKVLPVSFWIHWDFQVFLLCCLAIVLAVLYVDFSSVWGICDPCLANLSAFSFPKMPQWPGIHWSVIFVPWFVLALWQVWSSCSVNFDGLALKFAISSRADWLSVNITRSLGLMDFCENLLLKSWMVFMIAINSASLMLGRRRNISKIVLICCNGMQKDLVQTNL